jgi:hypothetical protein
MDGIIFEIRRPFNLSISCSTPGELEIRTYPEHLDWYIKLVQEYVPLVLTELLLNIDKSGFSNWEERKPNSFLIPLEG